MVRYCSEKGEPATKGFANASRRRERKKKKKKEETKSQQREGRLIDGVIDRYHG